MSDLFGNHIVGFPTRRLNSFSVMSGRSQRFLGTFGGYHAQQPYPVSFGFKPNNFKIQSQMLLPLKLIIWLGNGKNVKITTGFNILRSMLMLKHNNPYTVQCLLRKWSTFQNTKPMNTLHLLIVQKCGSDS